MSLVVKMLHKLNDLELVKVVSRPSKVCKTPYVADIELEDGNGTIVQAHCASLGCCGLCEAGSNILFAPMKNKDNPKKCMYSAQLAIINEKNARISPRKLTRLPNPSMRMALMSVATESK